MTIESEFSEKNTCWTGQVGCCFSRKLNFFLVLTAHDTTMVPKKNISISWKPVNLKRVYSICNLVATVSPARVLSVYQKSICTGGGCLLDKFVTGRIWKRNYTYESRYLKGTPTPLEIWQRELKWCCRSNMFKLQTVEWSIPSTNPKGNSSSDDTVVKLCHDIATIGTPPTKNTDLMNLSNLHGYSFGFHALVADFECLDCPRFKKGWGLK